ncbi:hypothetical protein B9Z55_008463 [Caenorhabditis nigoni]|nr:hypothetical protein B9Z55_008463 [Caenorhabditis nigoni]
MLKITSRKRDDVYFSILFWRRRILNGCYHNFGDERMKTLKVTKYQKMAFLKKEKEKRIQYVASMAKDDKDAAEKIAKYNIKEDPGAMFKREEQKKKNKKDTEDKRKNADSKTPVIEEPVLGTLPEFLPQDSCLPEMSAPVVNAQDTSAPGNSVVHKATEVVEEPAPPTAPADVPNNSQNNTVVQPEASATNAP